MSLVGFEKAVIRVLDSEEQATLGTNLFEIKGAKGEGATRTANISGLSSEPVKTYGSNMAYHTASNGVGDVKVEFSAIDIPMTVQNIVLGRKKKGKLATIGADTAAPECSLTLFTQTAAGETVAIGFYTGKFAMDAMDLETLDGSNKELTEDKMTFSAGASSEEGTKGDYIAFATSDDELTELKTKMKIAVA